MPTRAELALSVWARLARPEQAPPAGEWRTWLVTGGRGSGKTRAGAEWLVRTAVDHPGIYAVVAPTYMDARKVCVEGPSGILAVAGPMVTKYNRSLGEIWLADSLVRMDGADDGAVRVQGSNLSGCWCDEIALWRNWERAWQESIAFAVRVDPARICATGTPKAGHPLVKQLLAQADHVSRMHTADNAANLSKAALAELHDRYDGTRLGRQELEGEYLDDVVGALWNFEMLDRSRVAQAPDVGRVAVGVDPATGTGTTGIVVVALGLDGHLYVLDDMSKRDASPEQWASAVAEIARLRGATVVAEDNQGGQMVASVLRSAGVEMPVKMASARASKKARAEPVAVEWERTPATAHVVGSSPLLEDELTSWVPGEKSPDRLDAMVWAATWLRGTAKTKVKGFATVDVA